MKPGEIFVTDGPPIDANAGRPMATLLVQNTGDRPIQVGSHFHFFEANRALRFDRAAAYGMRLNVAAGTAIRFEPGEEKEIVVVSLGGTREVYGNNGLVMGALDDPKNQSKALADIADQGFLNQKTE